MSATQTIDRPAPPPPTRPEPAMPQLGRGAIAAVWAAAAVPMALLAWVVAPAIAGGLDGPAALVRGLLIALTAGLVWQAVLVAVLVRRERGSLRPSVVREALWLRAPESPRSGRRGGRVWLVVIPLVAASAVEQTIPFLPHPASRDFGEFLGSGTGHAFLSGAWGWFALVIVLGIFNTVLGEELLFRGYLLPRMRGAFGRRDWLANGLLFAAYHLHVPWAIPATLLDTVVLSYPSRRYRSALIGIAVHSAQTVVVTALALALVLGG